MKRILVGLDGSQLAEAALPCAEQLARASGGRCILVRATPMGEALEPLDDLSGNGSGFVHPHPVEDDCQGAADPTVGEAWDYLLTTAQLLRAQGILAETAVVPGDPAEVLVDEARSRRADLIVLTTHCRSGLGRLINGSVADRVLRNSPIPVLLVRATMTHRDIS